MIKLLLITIFSMLHGEITDLRTQILRRTLINRMCVSQSFLCSPGSPEKQTVMARASRRWPSNLVASMPRPQPWGSPAWGAAGCHLDVLRGIAEQYADGYFWAAGKHAVTRHP